MNFGKKKRPLCRDESSVRDAKLIVIATEGSDTEKIYFSIFGDSRVKVHTIPSQGGFSAPQHILKNAQKFRETYDLDGDDELWIAIDHDGRKNDQLSEVASACAQQDIKLALSNPRFELWLYLHFWDDLPEIIDKNNIEDALRSFLGSYNKSNYDCRLFRDHVEAACRRAENIDKNKNDRWPQAPGSRVYKIVNSILSSCLSIKKVVSGGNNVFRTKTAPQKKSDPNRRKIEN